jgi:proton-dependent oligopeptide transporter, POT family
MWATSLTVHNKHLIEKMYNWFYFSINAGAVIAYITAEPLLRSEYLISKGLNTTVAFGLPGILMVIATVIFWMGRKKFTTVKPAGWKLYREELFSKKGLEMVLRLAPVFLFLSVFWSLFDQTGSAWVIQADSDLMNKTINLGFVSFDFYPSQIGFFNPLLVVILIPVFTAFLYPYLRSRFNLNYISKMTIGMVLAAVSFALISWVQGKMDNGIQMTIAWQILGFFILTSAEIFVSISSLEFSYTQAPNSLKSLILSFWLLATAIGNGFTALINFFIKRPDGTLLLDGAAYFWFFTILMAVSAVLFYIVNRNYKETFYTQDMN